MEIDHHNLMSLGPFLAVLFSSKGFLHETYLEIFKRAFSALSINKYLNGIINLSFNTAIIKIFQKIEIYIIILKKQMLDLLNKDYSVKY